jgi:NAD(P)-dependent dehydrogenase (short-subunit alcohol dehydrogenase family)
MIDGQSPVSEAVGRDKSRVTGKHILITGGTNGIGLAAAEALAELGENICVVGRNETRTKIAARRRFVAKRHQRLEAGQAIPTAGDELTINDR